MKQLLNKIEIKQNYDLFELIIDSFKLNKNKNQFHDTSYEWKFDPNKIKIKSFNEVLSKWIGTPIKYSDEVYYKNIINYLNNFNLSNDFKKIYNHKIKKYDFLTRSQLNTIQDFLLIDLYKKKKLFHKNSINYLEIGAGYGNLVEEFINNSKSNIKYFLSDAHPLSIYYQYLFLKKQFPHLKIILILDTEKVNFDDFDIIICPNWLIKSHFSEIGFDIFVNIASFQECSNKTNQKYFEFIDESLDFGSLIYFINSRNYPDYKIYKFPKTWRHLVKDHNQRSNTIDFPTEILIKDKSDKNSVVILNKYNERLLSRYDDNLKNYLLKSRANKITSSKRFENLNGIIQKQKKIIHENKITSSKRFENLNSIIQKQKKIIHENKITSSKRFENLNGIIQKQNEIIKDIRFLVSKRAK